MRRLEMTRRGNAVHVASAYADWVLLADGTDLTLIDGGYPAQAQDVERAVASLGHRMEDIRAALVTHAHVDHVGGTALLARRYGFPVYADQAEAAHVRGEYVEQLSPARSLTLLTNAGSARWLAAISRLGIFADRTVPACRPFPRAGALDLPGGPVPVAVPGHTRGHSGFLVPAAGVVVTGDALVTAHPTSSARGPQLLRHQFHADAARARDALSALAGLDAGSVFPGHGPALDQPVHDAVDQALAGAADPG